mmetsp:Transcript_166242/g.533803  ORF Transcript_166242/g.533803 Transcript_166242/m.533803 type:complete len:342 (+) Transcript_166242:399-1424(+)
MAQSASELGPSKVAVAEKLASAAHHRLAAPPPIPGRPRAAEVRLQKPLRALHGLLRRGCRFSPRAPQSKATVPPRRCGGQAACQAAHEGSVEGNRQSAGRAELATRRTPRARGRGEAGARLGGRLRQWLRWRRRLRQAQPRPRPQRRCRRGIGIGTGGRGLTPELLGLCLRGQDVSGLRPCLRRRKLLNATTVSPLLYSIAPYIVQRLGALMVHPLLPIAAAQVQQVVDPEANPLGVGWGPSFGRSGLQGLQSMRGVVQQSAAQVARAFQRVPDGGQKLTDALNHVFLRQGIVVNTSEEVFHNHLDYPSGEQVPEEEVPQESHVGKETLLVLVNHVSPIGI